MHRRLVVICAVVGSSLGLAACGSSTSTPSVPNGLSGSSGSALVAAASAAILAQQSMQVKNDEKVGTITASVINRTTLTAGEQVVTGITGNGQVKVVGGKTYVYGDNGWLSNTFGSGTNQGMYANQWILVPASDPNYQSIHSGVVLPSLVGQVMPVGPFTVEGIKKFNGKDAYAIKGSLNAQTNQGTTGSDTLYLSLSKPYLPLGVKASTSFSGEKATITATFSDYGKSFTITAPTTSLVSTSTSLQ